MSPDPDRPRAAQGAHPSEDDEDQSLDADDAFVVDMCKRVFEGSAKPCLGRVLAKEGLQEDLHNSTLTFRVPFYWQTSPECHGYYRQFFKS